MYNEEDITMSANRNYKDSLFIDLFSKPETLRELYNAIADTNYGEETPIEVNTLENVLVKGKTNDVSFIIGGKSVVLIEHQSSINENMPLRCLMYIGQIYEKIVERRSAYNETLVKIPTPEFIVLYNGVKPYCANETLKLSDAYIYTDESQNKFGHLELTVRVANINPGYNDDLLQKSETLQGYSLFINRVRHNLSIGFSLSDALKESISWCINQGILATYLTQHRSEVENMLLTEFNIDVALEVKEEETDAKWQAVVADKNAELADKDAELADKNTELADKNTELANKDEEIAQLRAKLKELQAK
jgi:hypothetical protein